MSEDNSLRETIRTLQESRERWEKILAPIREAQKRLAEQLEPAQKSLAAIGQQLEPAQKSLAAIGQQLHEIIQAYTHPDVCVPTHLEDPQFVKVSAAQINIETSSVEVIEEKLEVIEEKLTLFEEFAEKNIRTFDATITQLSSILENKGLDFPKLIEKRQHDMIYLRSLVKTAQEHEDELHTTYVGKLANLSTTDAKVFQIQKSVIDAQYKSSHAKILNHKEALIRLVDMADHNLDQLIIRFDQKTRESNQERRHIQQLIPVYIGVFAVIIGQFFSPTPIINVPSPTISIVVPYETEYQIQLDIFKEELENLQKTLPQTIPAPEVAE